METGIALAGLWIGLGLACNSKALDGDDAFWIGWWGFLGILIFV